mgnify:FL=1
MLLRIYNRKSPSSICRELYTQPRPLQVGYDNYNLRVVPTEAVGFTDTTVPDSFT